MLKVTSFIAAIRTWYVDLAYFNIHLHSRMLPEKKKNVWGLERAANSRGLGNRG